MHKRKEKTKEWQFKGSTDKEETRDSDADSEVEKVSWKKESKRGITNQQNSLAAFVFIYVLLQFLLPTLYKFTIQYNTIPEENSSEPNV